MDYLIILLQVIVGLSILNVWLLQREKATRWRGGDATDFRGISRLRTADLVGLRDRHFEGDPGSGATGGYLVRGADLPSGDRSGNFAGGFRCHAFEDWRSFAQVVPGGAVPDHVSGAGLRDVFRVNHCVEGVFN